MTPLEAFRVYMAVKLHFETDGYDYHRYRGEVSSARQSTLDKNRARAMFMRLARMRDVEGRMVAECVRTCPLGRRVWVGDVLGGEDCYQGWAARRDRLMYRLRDEMSANRVDDLRSFLSVGPEAPWPRIVSAYMRGEVSPETLVAVAASIGLVDRWRAQVDEPAVWPGIDRLLRKYPAFLDFDRAAVRAFLVDEHRRPGV